MKINVDILYYFIVILWYDICLLQRFASVLLQFSSVAQLCLTFCLGIFKITTHEYNAK